MRAAALLLALGAAAAHARADDPLVAVHVSREAGERHGHFVLSVIVAPAPGLRLLDDGPLTLDLIGEATRTLRRRDAVDPRAETPRFEVPVEKSETMLRAHLAAWVCRGERCRPVELDEEIPVSR